MNVLFVLHAPRDPHTAVFSYAVERARFLESKGHRASVLTPFDLVAPGPGSVRWLPFTYPLAVRRHLARHGRGLDLVIFHSYTGWAVHLLDRRRRFATATQFHGLEPLYLDRMEREHRRAGTPIGLRHRLFRRLVLHPLLAASCRRSHRVLCLNREERDYLVEHGWATSAAATVVPNPAPEEFFGQRQCRRPPSRLLFLGQWSIGKGTRYLAEAFASLAAAHPDLALVCLGTRADAATVRADFPAACRERVQVVPEADRAAVAGHLAEADLFVFPTLSEGSSLALLEAMASGLPIVTTPVGAAPDHLANGESALFVPPADAAALAAAVERLLADPDLAERLGRAARRAAEALRWSALAPGYLALVESLAPGTGKGH